MKTRTLYVGLSIVTVVAILVLAISTGLILGPGAGGRTSSTSSNAISETNSVQGVNQTVIATHVTAETSSTTSSTSGTSTVSTTTTYQTTTQSLSTGGSYSYNPSSQIKVLTVAATVSGSQPNHRIVTFSVQFENVGTGMIYVQSGGGSSLSATITSGASQVQQVSSPRCEIATALGPIGPGGDWTATTPGCWSGFYYQLLGSGTIQVQLTLDWSSDGQGSGGGSLVIGAEFTLS